MYRNNIKVEMYDINGESTVVNGNTSFSGDRSQVICYRLYVNDAPMNVTVIPEGCTFVYMHRCIGVLSGNACENRYLRVGYAEKDANHHEQASTIEEFLV